MKSLGATRGKVACSCIRPQELWRCVRVFHCASSPWPSSNPLRQLDFKRDQTAMKLFYVFLCLAYRPCVAWDLIAVGQEGRTRRRQLKSGGHKPTPLPPPGNECLTIPITFYRDDIPTYVQETAVGSGLSEYVCIVSVDHVSIERTSTDLPPSFDSGCLSTAQVLASSSAPTRILRSAMIVENVSRVVLSAFFLSMRIISTDRNSTCRKCLCQVWKSFVCTGLLTSLLTLPFLSQVSLATEPPTALLEERVTTHVRQG